MFMLILEVLMYSAIKSPFSWGNSDSSAPISAFSSSMKIRGTPAASTDIISDQTVRENEKTKDFFLVKNTGKLVMQMK